MRIVESVLVDSEKFRKILEERKLSCMKIAKDMGHAKKYISNKTYGNPGRFSLADVKFLEAVYNIKYEDYKYEPPKAKAESKPEAKAEAQTPEAKAVMAISPVKITNPVELKASDDLYKMIYSACFNAFTEALKK